MFEVTVTNNRASTKRGELLTEGQVGAKVHFSFNDHWTNMKKSAVFKRCGKTIVLTDTEWDGETAPVPPEMTEKAGQLVHVGVYGVSEDGKQITPTLYAPLGVVAKGAKPDGDPSTDPTLPVWAQIQGDLDKAVKVVPQNFTDDEKAQAFSNVTDRRRVTYTVAGYYPGSTMEVIRWLTGDGTLTVPPESASADVKNAFRAIVLMAGSVTTSYDVSIAYARAALTLYKEGLLIPPIDIYPDAFGTDTVSMYRLTADGAVLVIDVYAVNTGHNNCDINIADGSITSSSGSLVLKKNLPFNKSGPWTMPQVEMAKDPSKDAEIATKKYVDSNALKVGGTWKPSYQYDPVVLDQYKELAALRPTQSVSSIDDLNVLFNLPGWTFIVNEDTENGYLASMLHIPNIAFPIIMEPRIPKAGGSSVEKYRYYVTTDGQEVWEVNFVRTITSPQNIYHDGTTPVYLPTYTLTIDKDKSSPTQLVLKETVDELNSLPTPLPRLPGAPAINIYKGNNLDGAFVKADIIPAGYLLMGYESNTTGDGHAAYDAAGEVVLPWFFGRGILGAFGTVDNDDNAFINLQFPPANGREGSNIVIAQVEDSSTVYTYILNKTNNWSLPYQANGEWFLNKLTWVDSDDSTQSRLKITKYKIPLEEITTNP